MTSFDDRFAERVREAFDAYHEPVDPAALARLQAALDADRTAPAPAAPAHGGAAPASPDRPPARGLRQPGRRWPGRRAIAALAALVVALGGGLLALQLTDRSGPAAPAVAEASGDEPAAAPDAAAPDAAAPVQDAGASRGQEAVAAAEVPDRSGPAEAVRSESAPGNQSVALAQPRRSSGERSVGELAAPEADARPAVAAAQPARSEEPLRDAPSVPEPSAPDAPASEPSSPEVAGADRPGVRAPRPLVAVASLPPDVAADARRGRDSGPLPLRPVGGGTLRAADPASVRAVVATTTAFAGGERAEGGGLSAGLARDWRLGRGVSLSGGAAASYTRLTVGPRGVTASQAFDAVAQDPSAEVDVTTRSTLTTVAVEVPLDLAVDVVRTRHGRLGVAVGVTSALYLAQTFEDTRQRVSGEVVPGVTADDPRVALSSEPFAARETGGPLGRLDLARQLNLTLRLAGAGRRPLALDAYTRLPLGGLTSRDLPLTTLGLRLRVTL